MGLHIAENVGVKASRSVLITPDGHPLIDSSVIIWRKVFLVQFSLPSPAQVKGGCTMQKSNATLVCVLRITK